MEEECKDQRVTPFFPGTFYQAGRLLGDWNKCSSTKMEWRISKKLLCPFHLKISAGLWFVYAVTVKPFNGSYDIWIHQIHLLTEQSKVFVLSWLQVRLCLCTNLSVSRSMTDTRIYRDRLEIWNQSIWYKGGVTYV